MEQSLRKVIKKWKEHLDRVSITTRHCAQKRHWGHGGNWPGAPFFSNPKLGMTMTSTSWGCPWSPPPIIARMQSLRIASECSLLVHTWGTVNLSGHSMQGRFYNNNKYLQGYLLQEGSLHYAKQKSFYGELFFGWKLPSESPTTTTCG